MATVETEHTIGQFSAGETGHFVRDNLHGPTGKIVRAILTADDGSALVVEDPVSDPIPAGQSRLTHLESLDVKIVWISIHWTQVGMGIAHPLNVPAPAGRFFRTFALRWGGHDQVTTSYTTGPLGP